MNDKKNCCNSNDIDNIDIDEAIREKNVSEADQNGGEYKSNDRNLIPENDFASSLKEIYRENINKIEKTGQFDLLDILIYC